MKIVTVAEMQAIEREANENGWTYSQMMEAAGNGLAELVQSFYGYEETQSVLGLVGSGNNGGDTLIALEALARQAWQVRAYLVRPRPAEDPLVQRVINAGGEVVSAEDDLGLLGDWLREALVILDGVLGTGVHLPLKAEVGRVLEFVKNSPDLGYVVAVDCPSGVDLDSGEAAPQTIPASLTVCMAAVKQGLLRFPAYGVAGSLEVVDIGLPAGVRSWEAIQSQLVTEEMVQAWMPKRVPDSHKGSYGTVGVVGGSVNFSGAALLAAEAAHRIGAGLVQIAAPAPLYTAMASCLPEATWVLLPHEEGVIAERAVEELLKHSGRMNVLLLGPGIGVEETTASFIRRLVAGKKASSRSSVGFVSNEEERTSPSTRLPAMVVDADGLKLLAKIANWHEKLPAETVLTPHPGEMSILTGKTVQEIQADRLGTAVQFAREWGHVVVLKGALTVVAAPDGRTRVIPVATSALAHGGTGDVLAGMIAGLRAQQVAAFDAACAAAWIHGQTGLLAAEQVGHEAAVLAGDLLQALPEVLAWVW